MQRALKKKKVRGFMEPTLLNTMAAYYWVTEAGLVMGLLVRPGVLN
jgi:hypothetical protein